MSKVKRIIGIIVFLFIMGHTCFADVIMPGENPRNHGGGYYNVNENYITNNVVNNVTNRASNNKMAEKFEEGTSIITYLVIGGLILVIVVCTIMVIHEIAKKREE